MTGIEEIVQGILERFGTALLEDDGSREAEIARNRVIYADEIKKGEQAYKKERVREEKCSICHDTGMVDLGSKFDDDRDGYWFVDYCVCQKARKQERLLRDSGLSQAVNEMTFERFQTPEKWQQQLLSMGKRYIERVLDGQKPWLFVSGQSGCGKTHICTAVCGELLRAGRAVRYALWTQEARQLKAHAAEPDFETLLAPFADTEILYLDDVLKPIGMDKTPTEADLKLLFEIVNRRYMKRLPTIFSSELSLNDITALDEATGSRINEKARGFGCNVGRKEGRNWRMKGD